MTNRPLSGIRVLDLGQYIAGPGACQMLSDLGADVVKVESLRGDQARSVGTFGEAMVQAYNRDKRSIALDLRHPDGASVLHDLLATADVVVHNFRQESAERLGLGAAELLSRYPRLVLGTVTGFGTAGPSRNRPGLDIAAQAEFGLMHVTGAADGQPQRVGFPVADVATANALATGVLAALYQRTVTGRGAHVQTSLMEATLAMQAAGWSEYMVTGTAPRRKGNGQAYAAPAADVVELIDGPIVLSAYTDEKWSALCTLIDRQDMIEDPRFVDNPARVAHRDDLLTILSDAFGTMTRDQAVELLLSANIVCGSIRSFDDIVDDDDVAASGILIDVVADDGSVHTAPGPAFTLDDVTPPSSSAAPTTGRDTATVLGEIGYSDDEVDRLRRSGVVLTDFDNDRHSSMRRLA
ncbi:CaiB/BaiF CoA-transferase family protein [Gordonia sp. OPL2]|jgi:crotonobetainyl-CoA:carnitine CoA-transferase CaiB-like acyl-CoA transferase|uniref:CaiB/BaiF CoA transferase family protein n=1 Tax=Gordonia sp. OPL2 TaxID=2486274 RepID=UPI001655973C|nr:CoA transferase [Gordonia sp. OPL2]RPA12459.1 CoA transferase [Gordonia sp. OPL2]